MSGILKIKLGEEYKAKVENISEFDNSIFRDIYIKGFESLISILNSNPSEKERLHENYNNIIAFVGERGTGKTSAMLSFAGALNKNALDTPTLNFFKNFDINKINSKIFSHIGVIDPSLLSHNSNILEIIVAKLFQSFKLKVEDKNKDYDENKKRDLIGHFEKVYENIRIINNKKDVYQDEALDALLKMSATTDLKDNLIKLVSSYLAFMNKLDANNIENSKLVIQVDDIDLNTKHAYEMVEQIRKYLILPNVVILMAVKVEQLSQIIERNYRTEFDILFKDNNMHYDEIKNMAEKYLEKFIPLEKRLYLPKLDDINLEINFKIIFANDSNKEFESNSIDKGIRKLIYEKTDMIFWQHQYKFNYIVPKNLREFINFATVLCNLSSENKQNNFKELEKYFFDTWCKNNITSIQKSILNELYKKEVELKNKYIITKLNSIYNSKKEIDDSKPDSKSEYSSIINFNNNPINISIGDVLFILNKINYFTQDENDKKFIFAIKTIYSFMLYNLYNSQKTESTKYSRYQRLLGGCIYNINNEKILTNEKSGNLSRDRRIINLTKLKEELKSIDEDIQDLIFNFLDSFVISYKKLISTKNYRLEDIALFNKNDFIKDTKEKEATFDILGFFFTKATEILDNKLYIGNIEFLEEILKYDFNTEGQTFFDHLKSFFIKFLNCNYSGI